MPARLSTLPLFLSPGVCRTWKSSAANRPQRPIFGYAALRERYRRSKSDSLLDPAVGRSIALEMPGLTSSVRLEGIDPMPSDCLKNVLPRKPSMAAKSGLPCTSSPTYAWQMSLLDTPVLTRSQIRGYAMVKSCSWTRREGAPDRCFCGGRPAWLPSGAAFGICAQSSRG